METWQGKREKEKKKICHFKNISIITLRTSQFICSSAVMLVEGLVES